MERRARGPRSRAGATLSSLPHFPCTYSGVEARVDGHQPELPGAAGELLGGPGELIGADGELLGAPAGVWKLIPSSNKSDSISHGHGDGPSSLPCAQAAVSSKETHDLANGGRKSVRNE